MRTQLLIIAIALGSFALFASCVSEEELRRQAEENARQEQIAREQAEQERIAREKLEAEEREHQRISALRACVKDEIKITLANLDDILMDYNKLSEEKRSLGIATLEAFGNEHLPFFMEKYRIARTKAMEAEQNFNELVEELNNSGIEKEKDETYRIILKNKRELQATYWTIFYEITDRYSEFKIGILNADDFIKLDKDLCEIY